MAFWDSLFDDPLKLALLAGTVMTAGAAAPALAAAEGGAAAAGGTAAGGLLGGEAATGLLGAEAGATGLSAGAGGATGLKASADMLGANSVMHGGLLNNTVAPAYTGGLTAGSATLPTTLGQPSMWETAQGFMKQAKPYTDAVGTGVTVAKALSPNETPPPQVTSQLPPRQPMEFPFSQMPLQAITDDNERRKRMMQQYVQNMRY